MPPRLQLRRVNDTPRPMPPQLPPLADAHLRTPRVSDKVPEALRDAALCLGKASRLKRFRDDDEGGIRTVLPPIVTPLINIDAVSERPHVKVVLSSDFDSVLRIARSNVTSANRIGHTQMKVGQ